MQRRGVPRVEWRGLQGNFNTQNQYFLDLQIPVDLSEISGEDPSFRMLRGNLWRYSEFQNIQKKDDSRFVTVRQANVVSPFLSTRGKPQRRGVMAEVGDAGE